MKYCKNCAWFKPDEVTGNYPTCLEPSVQEESPVDGKPIPKFCNIQRSDYSISLCGPDATLFTERAPAEFNPETSKYRTLTDELESEQGARP